MKPCTKVSFATEAYANVYLSQLSKTSSRSLKPVRSYLCENCLAWHLTSISEYTKKEADYDILIKKKQNRLNQANNKIKQLEDYKKFQTKEIKRVITWLEALSHHVCGRGYIGCKGGKLCDSDHK